MSIEIVTQVNLLTAFLTSDSSLNLTHVAMQDSIGYESALQTMDKWSEINDGHHNEKRMGERYQYRGAFTLVFVLSEMIEDTQCQQLVLIEVCGKDLSTKGARLLCPEHFLPIKFEDNSVSLKLSHVISVSDHVALGIPQADGDWKIMKAEVCRIRNTANGLNDIGVRFIA